MINSLKRKYFFMCLAGASVFWVFAAVVVGSEIDNIKALFTAPVEFYNLKTEDIRKGVVVHANVKVIYDYYSYREENGHIAEKQFLIPVADKKYMGMSCTGSDIRTANENLMIYQDNIDNRGFDESLFPAIEVKGTIMPLEDESLFCFNEYLNGMNLTDEEKADFLPYVLMVDKIGNETAGNMIFMFVFLMAPIITGSIFFVNGLRSNNIKTLEKYCRKKGNKELYMRLIEQFYHSGTPVHGVRINREYFMAVTGVKVYFAETNDLVWIYPRIIKNSVNFISAGKNYFLCVCKADGTLFDIRMKNETAVYEAMEYSAENMPYLYMGFKKELFSVYNTTPAAVANDVEKRRQKYMANHDS